MFRFELHCHSHYSRGRKIPTEALASPSQLVRVARNKGLSGIALTDHSTIRGWKEAEREAKKQGIVFIPGIEIASAAGHVIGLGLSSRVEDGLSLDETVERIREQGGVSIAPHPFDVRGEGIGNGIAKVDVVEVFNSLNLDRLSNVFAERRARKFGKPAVAGSDVHTLDMIGRSYSIIDVMEPEAVLREIRRGRVLMERNYVSLESLISWARGRLRRSYSDVLAYVDKNYFPPKAWVSRTMLNSFVKSDSFAWGLLARFGLNCAVLYSACKLLTHW